MKKFIIKLFFFIILIFVTNHIIHLLVPMSYGNVMNAMKMDYLSTHLSNFNTLFIGSSQTFREINPDCFDKNTNTEVYTKSFNLGTPGTLNPESYYLFDKLLEKDAKNIKYIVMELKDVSPLTQSQKIHTSKGRYYAEFNDILFALKTIKASSRSIENKIDDYNDYITAFVEKSFNLELYKDLKEYRLKYEESIFPKMNYNGYVSFDNEDNNDKIERQKRLKFESDTFKLQHLIKENTEYFLDPNSKHFNKVHYKRMLSMINKCEKKGIQLIFFIPPQTYLKEIISIFNKIPEENRIELANYSYYPEFYLARNTYSLYHLNNQGAEILSKLLSKEFCRVVSLKRAKSSNSSK